MAHPRLQAASRRKALTVGMTAALLAVPMAGVGTAATATDLLDEQLAEEGLLDAVEGTLEGVEDTASQVLEPVSEPVEETVQKVTETTAPVTQPVEEVVEKVVESVTGTTPAPPAANDPKPVVPAPNDDKPTTTAGGPYEPVDEPRSTTTTPTTTSPDRPGAGVRTAGGEDGAAPVTAETAPAALQHEFTHSGLRSANGGLTLQPFQAPIVSNPFALQAPEVADDVLTATPSPSVAQAFEASATELPRQLTEEGLPGGLTATAAGLLLMVGAGHLLHRSGRLRVAVIS